MSVTMARVGRCALALMAAGAMVGGVLLSSASTALADYGAGAQYQVEISDNCNGPGSCIPGVVKGFGVWLWIELNSDGTGDYEAADCGHIGPGNTPGATGAFHDSGDVTWAYSNGGSTITIQGAAIFGNTVPIVVSVHAAYGHYTAPTVQVLTVPALGPLPGSAQVQVAH
jgi:hypothetical protein